MQQEEPSPGISISTLTCSSCMQPLETSVHYCCCQCHCSAVYNVEERVQAGFCPSCKDIMEVNRYKCCSCCNLKHTVAWTDATAEKPVSSLYPKLAGSHEIAGFPTASTTDFALALAIVPVPVPAPAPAPVLAQPHRTKTEQEQIDLAIALSLADASSTKQPKSSSPTFSSNLYPTNSDCTADMLCSREASELEDAIQASIIEYKQEQEKLRQQDSCTGSPKIPRNSWVERLKASIQEAANDSANLQQLVQTFVNSPVVQGSLEQEGITAVQNAFFILFFEATSPDSWDIYFNCSLAQFSLLILESVVHPTFPPHSLKLLHAWCSASAAAKNIQLPKLVTNYR